MFNAAGKFAANPGVTRSSARTDSVPPSITVASLGLTTSPVNRGWHFNVSAEQAS